jgi:hypothetical protein
MPRLSRCAIKLSKHRKLFCFRMRALLFWEVFMGEDDPMEFDFDNLITAIYLRARGKCFHFCDKHYQSHSISTLDNYLEMNDHDFLLHFWIQKESFWKLHDYMESCDCFSQKQKPNGIFYKPQCPVKYQLLIFLYVIGATGSNGIYRKVGSRFNISSGAVRLYVDRVTHAILDTIECNTVY